MLASASQQNARTLLLMQSKPTPKPEQSQDLRELRVPEQRQPVFP